jgi:hypothetical protein
MSVLPRRGRVSPDLITQLPPETPVVSQFDYPSLRGLRVLCVSAVNLSANALTAETQRTPS